MSEMLLLGAGASVEAGVPGAFGMTGKIMDHFRASPLLKEHAAVISFVTGGLLFKKGIQGDDPLTSGVNVEELNNNPQSRLRIVNPSFAHNQNDYAHLLRMWAKDRLEIIAEQAGKGLAQIYGDPVPQLVQATA